MIVNSKERSLNYILLKRGGYKLYSHKALNKPNLPLILYNYQKYINILSSRTSKNRIKNVLMKNKYSTPKSSIYISKRMEDFSSSYINNKDNSEPKTRNCGTSTNDIGNDHQDKALSHLNTIENNSTVITYRLNKGPDKKNNDKSNKNNDDNINNNEENLSLPEQFKNDEFTTNSTRIILSNIKRKNMMKQKEMKQKESIIKEKKKLIFLKKFMRSDKNYIINEYLKNHISSKNNRFFSCINKNERNSFLNIKKENQKKDMETILVKDIRINSLLNNYENKKLQLLKLKPIILRNNYLKKKYENTNKFSIINDYELKMNLKKKINNHFKVGNILKAFDINNKKQFHFC